MLTDYTDQQRRISRSFSHGGTCCSCECEACGRTYFVTSPGHGDYEPGELDGLRERASYDPLCIEIPDYGSVETMIMPLGPHLNKQVVVGCSCGVTDPLGQWIEKHADSLTTYLVQYHRDRGRTAAEIAKQHQEQLAALEWSSMDYAPRDGSWIVVEIDNETIRAHWAEDLSGEEQPPFSGWFAEDGAGSYRQVHPVRWRKDNNIDDPSEQP